MTDDDISPHANQELMSVLPEALTPEEVDHLGERISRVAESERPSFDGISRGRKEEDRVITRLGFIAAESGDLVTAESAKQHLRRRPLTVTGLVGSFVLKHRIKQHSKAIIDSLQNT
jgi:hypothetical protein